VSVNPADYVGRPYNDVASALMQLGLTPSPTSVATTGEPGTVAGVDPAGTVQAGSTVTVQVVSGSAPPPSGGKGGGKSHKPPKGKDTGGNGG
jgi:serine/threonine-protein kinase